MLSLLPRGLRLALHFAGQLGEEFIGDLALGSQEQSRRDLQHIESAGDEGTRRSGVDELRARALLVLLVRAHDAEPQQQQRDLQVELAR